MELLMPNIRKLRDDLRKNDWVITAFPFTYKQKTYVVIFEDAKALHIKTEYYIAQLTFIDSIDENHILSTLANSSHFKVSAKEFREFFDISYTTNLGDIFQQFYSYFSKFIPETMPQKLDDTLEHHVLHIIDKRENQQNAIYCFKAFRNGIVNDKQRHRTPYNADKTKLRRPNLYQYFKDDNTISFAYSADPLEEKTDLEIIQNFIKREKINP